MADLKKLAEEIVGLTLLEAQELKTILKDEYGIEPAAGGAVMMASSEGGEAASGGEEQSEFDVILKAAGGKAIKEGASKEEAEEIKGKLEAAGAEVELK